MHALGHELIIKAQPYFGPAAAARERPRCAASTPGRLPACRKYRNAKAACPRASSRLIVWMCLPWRASASDSPGCELGRGTQAPRRTRAARSRRTWRPRRPRRPSASPATRRASAAAAAPRPAARCSRPRLTRSSRPARAVRLSSGAPAPHRNLFSRACQVLCLVHQRVGSGTDSGSTEVQLPSSASASGAEAWTCRPCTKRPQSVRALTRAGAARRRSCSAAWVSAGADPEATDLSGLSAKSGASADSDDDDGAARSPLRPLPARALPPLPDAAAELLGHRAHEPGARPAAGHGRRAFMRGCGPSAWPQLGPGAWRRAHLCQAQATQSPGEWR